MEQEATFALITARAAVPCVVSFPRTVPRTRPQFACWNDVHGYDVSPQAGGCIVKLNHGSLLHWGASRSPSRFLLHLPRFRAPRQSLLLYLTAHAGFFGSVDLRNYRL